MSYDYGWKPYVSVAERRRKAEREMARLHKKGHISSPVVSQGRMLAKTFWGQAWCDNLESYSDYANRLPRGRTYLRNGSVVDLQLRGGEVTALVSGSQLYTVNVKVAPIPKPRWSAIRSDCAGSIDSLVELLQGHLSKSVMERVCQQRTGLFPAPKEIELSCSCPDWASMCKHVAAVLYGIGVRLDEQPELAFRLRGVNEGELIATAAKGRTLATKTPAAAKVLDGDDLSALFGLEIEPSAKPEPRPKANMNEPKRTAAKKNMTDTGRAPAKKAIAELQATSKAAKVDDTGAKPGKLHGTVGLHPLRSTRPPLTEPRGLTDTPGENQNAPTRPRLRQGVKYAVFDGGGRVMVMPRATSEEAIEVITHAVAGEKASEAEKLQAWEQLRDMLGYRVVPVGGSI